MTENEKPKVGAPVNNENAAKPDEEKRAVNVQTPATGWEAAGWTKAAKAAGMKRPEWIRAKLNAAARRAGVKI